MRSSNRKRSKENCRHLFVLSLFLFFAVDSVDKLCILTQQKISTNPFRPSFQNHIKENRLKIEIQRTSKMSTIEREKNVNRLSTPYAHDCNLQDLFVCPDWIPHVRIKHPLNMTSTKYGMNITTRILMPLEFIHTSLFTNNLVKQPRNKKMCYSNKRNKRKYHLLHHVFLKLLYTILQRVHNSLGLSLATSG